MELIDVNPDEIAPARALRLKFANFWSTTQGEPRDVYDQFVAATPEAPGVSYRDSDLDGIDGVWVIPDGATEDRVILFIHGGGYGLGHAKAYRGFVSQIVSRTGIAAFALEYPLAPEARLPIALDLAVETAGRLKERFGRIAICGDSAGGGMSLAALAELRKKSIEVSAAVVFSPWTDLALTGESVKNNAVGDPLLDPAYLRISAEAYLGVLPLDDPRGSPYLSVPSGLPPVLVQVGSDEVLCDDSWRYAYQSRAAGNSVKIEEWQGMHHVFQLNVADLATSREALDHASTFLREHLA
jgi:epsilon-lactone hydrolase